MLNASKWVIVLRGDIEFINISIMICWVLYILHFTISTFQPNLTDLIVIVPSRLSWAKTQNSLQGDDDFCLFL